jgi:hypothetical protein
MVSPLEEFVLKNVPPGLKPAECYEAIGTAEAVPFPKPFHKTRPKEESTVVSVRRFSYFTTSR